MFTLPLSSCNIKISVVSQCRCTTGISWLFNISTHSLSHFFNWLTTCTYWTEQRIWSVLTRTETDWTCWLTVDTRVRKHKQRFETDSDSCHPLHPEYTTYEQYTAGCPYVNNGRTVTAAYSAAVSWLHHLRTVCYLRDFKKLPNQNSIDILLIKSDADIESFICSKLKDINECTSSSNMLKDVHERYVLFFKITSEIKT